MYELAVKTNTRTEMLDITRSIQKIASEQNWQSGLLTIFVPHTTAALTINENADPDVQRDMLMEMNKVVPFEDGYRHFEGNSAAHIKASLFGSSEVVILEKGQLQLGTWQGIYFCEFDGPRQRKVWLKFMSK